jgi:hypothetical protein
MKHGLLKGLEDTMQTQRSLSTVHGMTRGDDNVVVVDMDGRKVSADSLRWDEESDDEMPDSIADVSSDTGSVLNAEQKQEQVELIVEFEEVFNVLPAGSAAVDQ